MKSTRTLLIGGGLLLSTIAGISSCGKNPVPAAEAGFMGGHAAVKVKTATVRSAEVSSTLKVTGTLEGVREASVASETQGRVLAVIRTMGDRVSAGSPVVKVDDELKAVSLRQAEAQRMSAEASLDKARLDLARTAQLASDNAATKNQLELAQLQVKAADAQLRGAQAAESLAKRQLADATVKAPISGVISARFVNQGEMLAPGAKVFAIVDDSRMKLRMNINEMDITSLHAGETVNVSVDALGKTFPGKITSISGKADEAHSYQVEVELANNGSLRSGMFARAEIIRAAPKSVPTIPSEAVLTNGGRTQVYVVINGVAKLRAVKIGNAAGDNVEILDGLWLGDDVVTFGQSMLHDGAKVSSK